MLEFWSRCWMVSIMVGASWYDGVSFVLFSRRRETVMEHRQDDSWMTAVRWLFTTGREPIFWIPMTESVKKRNLGADVGSCRIRNFNPSRNAKSRVIFWYFFTHPYPTLRSLGPHPIITNLHIFLSLSCSFLSVASWWLSCSCTRFLPTVGQQ